MKMFWKNEDRVIDNLLRANAKGRSGTNPSCREFDPDLANAYIERSLTASHRAGYERHMSECHACRTSTVALARLSEVETIPTGLVQPVREEGRFATLRGLFTVATMPRVAAAALAVVVLAVSISLLVSRDESGSAKSQTASEVALGQAASRAEASPSAPAAAVGSPVAATDSQPQAEPKRRAESGEESDEPAQDAAAQAKPSPAEAGGAATGAVANQARVEPPVPDRVEAKAAVDNSEQARKTESDSQAVAKEQEPPPAPAPETPKPLGQINERDALRIPQRDKDAASVTIRGGRGDGLPGVEPKRAIRPDDSVAPPAQASESAGQPRGLAGRSRKQDAEEASGAAFTGRGSNMRKVGGKKFWLSKDTWIDKDYNPNKEMPVVTVERDSEIYKEMMAKREGLRLFLMGFSEGERAIFVYKGTVYRLVPQSK